MSTTATTIEAIDLTAGTVYRLFPGDDWATVKHVSFTFKRGAVHGVNIKNVEGRNRGCWLGAYEKVEVTR